MKNFYKKIIVAFMSLTIVTNLFNNEVVFAVESNDVEIDNLIPDEVYDFVNNNLDDIYLISKLYSREFGIDSDSNSKYSVGKPYVIYNIETDKQDEIYYFPILQDDEIVLVATVMGTEDGWSFSFSNDMADDLNEIDYIEQEDILFIQSEDNIVVETQDDEIVVVEGEQNKCISEFVNEPYESQKEEIVEHVQDDFVVPKFDENKMELTDSYSPSYEISKNGMKVFKPYNFQGQHGYGMCWACSVATTVNYLRGTNVSGQAVCLKMNVGFNQGANLNVEQSALQKYNVNYSRLRNIGDALISFSTIQRNINQKQPVIISSGGSNGSGHAITIIGYNTLNGDNWIVTWNSALNDGNGSAQGMSYKSSGTTYVMGNTTYKFRGSLSKY